MSSWRLFFMDRKKNMQGVSVADCAKIIADEWKSISVAEKDVRMHHINTTLFLITSFVPFKDLLITMLFALDRHGPKKPHKNRPN